MYTCTNQIPCCAIPILGTLHLYAGIHKQSIVVKILYKSMISGIKSQPESNLFKQSCVNMVTATIIMLVSL